MRLGISLALGASLLACTTVHPLGRIEDPATRTEVEAIASRPGTIAHLRPPPGARPSRQSFRASKLDAAGLWLVDDPGPPALVSPSAVASFSSYDHARGARDGAIIGGLAGIAATLTLAIVISLTVHQTCSDGCPPAPDNTWPIIRAAGILGLSSAVLGAALGAMIGHEDRYVVSPTAAAAP